MDELLEELPDFKEEEDKDPQKLQKEKERIGGQDLDNYKGNYCSRSPRRLPGGSPKRSLRRSPYR